MGYEATQETLKKRNSILTSICYFYGVIKLSFHFSQQVVTLEGWSELMYFVQDAYNFWVWIYFVTLISVSDLSINSFMTEISII